LCYNIITGTGGKISPWSDNMHFIRGKTSIDLENTAIDNIFIDDFMPSADGNYVKVYLLGYKYASNPEQYKGFSNENIARTLNILLSDVLKAWEYWEKAGIIKRHYPDGDDSGSFSVEFLNLKELYFENFCAIGRKNPKDKPYSTADLTQAMKDSAIRDMFHQIQQIVCRPLNPAESLQCLEWLYDYKMPCEVILQAFRYAVEKKGIKNIKYIGAIISNWYDKGINTVDKLDGMLLASDRKFALYNSVLRAMGITRNPSKKEKELMDKWFDQLNIPIEVVIEACDTAFTRVTNPTLSYIDGILKSWPDEESQTAKAAGSEQKEARSYRRKPAKTRFDNFEQTALKYTNEQLKEIWNKTNKL
jgi:DnaD/phage-associated family protein